MEKVDYLIVGAGIIGLSTAYALSNRNPDSRILVLEKETEAAKHQTGRNSGVIHSGIYYKPGSLKAKICKAGKQKLETFCQEHGVLFETCGKVIVATDRSEDQRLDDLFERGQANSIDCRKIETDELRELEPYVNGHRAIYVPKAGIVNYSAVCQALIASVEQAGHDIRFSEKVLSIRSSESEVIVVTDSGEFRAELLVNCAGLYSDVLAEAEGQQLQHRIIPFRGEYFDLIPEARKYCRNLIYPVPDPRFPFLGVHFTRRIGNSVDCGPNAVFAFGRESYAKTDFDLSETFKSLSYPGFIRFAAKHWRTGYGEFKRSLSKKIFVTALKRLVPEIEEYHLEPAPSGIRAQALSVNGKLIDDFLFMTSRRCVHVCNAPSPGATSSLEIAEYVVKKLKELG